MTMAAGKTGALLASACAIGAMLAEAPASVVTALERFGEHLGLAFQVADDILGIWGDPAVTGKPVMSDLRTRKKSIPVAAALCASDTFAALYSRPEPLTDHELDLARTLIEEAGGRSWAEAELTRQIDAAAQHLDVLGPNSAQRAELLAIADFVTTRDH
jgi:geranylgeranyl diphosphate synthase, type I